MKKPDLSIEELSRLLDGELNPEEERDIRARLERCELSRKLLTGMQELTATLSGAIAQAVSEAPPAETGTACLDDETLMLLSERKLKPEQLARVERHAAGCRHCLNAILREMRANLSMNAGKWRDLPDEVIDNPRLGGLPGIKKAQEARKKRKTAAAEEEMPADIAVESYGYTLSSGTTQSKVFACADNSIHLKITPNKDHTVNIELQLMRGGVALREAEVTIREKPSLRKIFRGLCNREGRIMVRKLRAASYEVFAESIRFMLRLNINE